MLHLALLAASRAGTCQFDCTRILILISWAVAQTLKHTKGTRGSLEIFAIKERRTAATPDYAHAQLQQKQRRLSCAQYVLLASASPAAASRVVPTISDLYIILDVLQHTRLAVGCEVEYARMIAYASEYS